MRTYKLRPRVIRVLTTFHDNTKWTLFPPFPPGASRAAGPRHPPDHGEQSPTNVLICVVSEGEVGRLSGIYWRVQVDKAGITSLLSCRIIYNVDWWLRFLECPMAPIRWWKITSRSLPPWSTHTAISFPIWSMPQYPFGPTSLHVAVLVFTLPLTLGKGFLWTCTKWINGRILDICALWESYFPIYVPTYILSTCSY